MQIFIDREHGTLRMEMSLNERDLLLKEVNNAYHLGAISLALFGVDFSSNRIYEELPRVPGRTLRNIVKNANKLLSTCEHVFHQETEIRTFFKEQPRENKYPTGTSVHLESILKDHKESLLTLSRTAKVHFPTVLRSLLFHHNTVQYVKGLLQDLIDASQFQEVHNPTGLFVHMARAGTRLDFPAGVREEHETLALQQEQLENEKQRRMQQEQENESWREALFNTLLPDMPVVYRGLKYQVSEVHETHLALTMSDGYGEIIDEILPRTSIDPLNFQVLTEKSKEDADTTLPQVEEPSSSPETEVPKAPEPEFATLAFLLSPHLQAKDRELLKTACQRGHMKLTELLTAALKAIADNQIERWLHELLRMLKETTPQKAGLNPTMS